MSANLFLFSDEHGERIQRHLSTNQRGPLLNAPSIDELQGDLDGWITEYNEARPHEGRWCIGKTPMGQSRLRHAGLWGPCRGLTIGAPSLERRMIWPQVSPQVTRACWASPNIVFSGYSKAVRRSVECRACPCSFDDLRQGRRRSSTRGPSALGAEISSG